MGAAARPQAAAELTRLAAAAIESGAADVDLVPVAVFWGRAPARERGLLELLFSAGWDFTGRISRLFATLVNGRAVFVHFGEPQPLAALIGDDPRRAARRIARHCRQELALTRAGVLGPDRSHRRTIANEILGSRGVREAVRARIATGKTSRRAALGDARRYVYEIAADYSPSFVAAMSPLLARLWNRLYDGIEVHNAARLDIADRGAQLIYVPAHRSHMDYLLLSYVIYHRGHPVPHIAAGINLNLPLIGPWLRKGGAFYIRRAFKGDVLYPAVFSTYLARMMARGHSLEYFIEGGRSRTGRLLPPKTGMLAMTVTGFLADRRRPVVFMPVYFSYERIFEGRDYQAELMGQPKRKESLLGLLSTLPKLKRRFGRVYVSFGEPLPLADMLDEQVPAWRQTRHGARRPAWLSGFTAQLALEIERRINGAAAVSPVALLALSLLATAKRLLPQAALERSVAQNQRLLALAPGNTEAWVTPLAPLRVIAHGEQLGLVVAGARHRPDRDARGGCRALRLCA